MLLNVISPPFRVPLESITQPGLLRLRNWQLLPSKVLSIIEALQFWYRYFYLINAMLLNTKAAYPRAQLVITSGGN